MDLEDQRNSDQADIVKIALPLHEGGAPAAAASRRGRRFSEIAGAPFAEAAERRARQDGSGARIGRRRDASVLQSGGSPGREAGRKL
jgi:hypothetical protein